jgi:hypothetical protein
MLLATALALILDVELLVLLGLPVSVLFCVTVKALCTCGWLTDSKDEVITIFTPSFTPHFSPELSDVCKKLTLKWQILKVNFIFLAHYIYSFPLLYDLVDTLLTFINCASQLTCGQAVSHQHTSKP